MGRGGAAQLAAVSAVPLPLVVAVVVLPLLDDDECSVRQLEPLRQPADRANSEDHQRSRRSHCDQKCEASTSSARQSAETQNRVHEHPKKTIRHRFTISQEHG
ncbi:hypothetical protein TYRP_010517 [Tyrophagus putrescentiae]|nr:hypothetical protein TYRP_010517 [Tyrophagus putrescentiae]